MGNVMQQEALLVIDGQQRLTTSTLLIAALAKHFENQSLGELLDAFLNKKLRNYYLLNPDEEGERHYKLILSETDKDTLLAILQSTPMPTEASTRITENYALFQGLIVVNQSELEAICKGLAKLVIVDVSLDRAQDNPQLIFESMNSTGLELSQADPIRNYILMGLEPKLQTELYKTYWRLMERAFGQSAYVVHFDAFMRHDLTAKTGEIPNVREVYESFKVFARAFKGNTRDLVAVSEEFLKLYVVYKAETNFVDVVPQVKRLRLSLNMSFHEIDDPKGICVDVTNLGRWGNGDVEIGLSSLDELPYVMGLIRQSFDRQMGGPKTPE